jgi:2-C-methyl-D-erythritol 4-phosphate cytidylyltransferase
MPESDAVPSYAVILPAAGKSSRFRDPHYKKPFAPLENRAVWLHSAEKFLNRDDVKQVVVCVAPEDRQWFQEKFGANIAILGIELVEGGRERGDTVRNALEVIRTDIDFVAVHDAARPCIAAEWIDQVFRQAQKTGAAMLAIPVTSTLKRVSGERVVLETVPRENLWEAQTPQVFRRELLVDAYVKFGTTAATDDAELVQRLGHPVLVVPGSPINLKITTKEDLRFAVHALKAIPQPKVLGPAHPFADDDLWR